MLLKKVGDFTLSGSIGNEFNNIALDQLLWYKLSNSGFANLSNAVTYSHLY
jgi:hypothetical protein